MRYLLMVLSLLLLPAATVQAEVSLRIGVPGISIGINVPAYPRFVRVPGYPVYYDPRINVNMFFYDGLYWVLQGDDWYVSSWYNGPWDWVDPYDVPVYVLRVPVRYYRVPPPYFHGWYKEAPPRWSEHWGREWHDRRGDWERRDRHAPPRPAPLPSYQKKYSGERYPHEEQRQYEIRNERYKYQPRDPVVQKQYDMHRPQGMPPGQEKKQQQQHNKDR